MLLAILVMQFVNFALMVYLIYPRKSPMIVGSSKQNLPVGFTPIPIISASAQVRKIPNCVVCGKPLTGKIVMRGDGVMGCENCTK